MYLKILACASFVVPLFSGESCFIAKENGCIVKSEGRVDERHSPVSSFKIAIALMGFDSGILETPQRPLIFFSEGIRKSIERWYTPQKSPPQYFWDRDHTPASWMKYSVIWYSQEITRKLGMDRFSFYIDKLSYGNRDVSGTSGENNGLEECWLMSSLKISALEQVEFIEKLSRKQLPFSLNSQEKTIEIIDSEHIWDEWVLYGKTGGSNVFGWFIGWIEKGARKIQFAQYLEVENPPFSLGRMAKELAKDNLVSLIL